MFKKKKTKYKKNVQVIQFDSTYSRFKTKSIKKM